MRSLFKASSLVVAFALGSLACASTSLDATRLGTKRYAALTENAPVAVFAKDSDVGCAIEPLALLHRHDMGKYQSLTLDDALPALKSQARSVGADALIIDKSESVISGVVSRGIDVEARAVRTTCRVPRSAQEDPPVRD